MESPTDFEIEPERKQLIDCWAPILRQLIEKPPTALRALVEEQLGLSAAWFISTPMRRIRSPCCALALSGHAATPPRNVMSSWRFTQSPRRRGR